jgi:hypothetical protein
MKSTRECARKSFVIEAACERCINARFCKLQSVGPCYDFVPKLMEREVRA